MINQINPIKLAFGGIIFLFSTALAYFTANFLTKYGSGEFWLALFVFAFVYILVGITVARVFPVSLGLLLSADVLMLNIIFEEFSGLPGIIKTTAMGVLLVLLYTFAWVRLKDRPTSQASPVGTNFSSGS